MFDEPLVIPDDDSLQAELDELNRQANEEAQYWTQNQLPPPSQIYRMDEQEWEHHVHSEAFIELFRILGFTQDQLDYVYKKVALNEVRGLRRIAKETRKQAIRQQIVDGIKPPPQS